ncbi:MAG: hypothetical protein ACK5JB_03245 [Pseudanabaena sp.]|jgi:hypothetical protein
MSIQDEKGHRPSVNISGGVIIQEGTFDVGVDKSKKYIHGDNIQTQINNSQDLARAAQDITSLLHQLSLDYPNDTHRILGARAVDAIEKNPALKDRLIRGIKAGSFAALEKLIDHPVAKFFIEGAKEAIKS